MLLRTRSPRRVRTPRRVQVELSQRVLNAADLHQGKYVISTLHLELQRKLEHPENSAPDNSETQTGAAREQTALHFVPVNWLSREITSFLLDSEMEEPMKPERAIRDEKEVRTATPAPSRGRPGATTERRIFPRRPLHWATKELTGTRKFRRGPTNCFRSGEAGMAAM